MKSRPPLEDTTHILSHFLLRVMQSARGGESLDHADLWDDLYALNSAIELLTSEVLPSLGPLLLKDKELRHFYLSAISPLLRTLDWEGSDGLRYRLLDASSELERRLQLRIQQLLRPDITASLIDYPYLPGVPPKDVHEAGLGYAGNRLSEATMYFAFVEEIESLWDGRSLPGVDSEEANRWGSYGEIRHIRFSAILADQFRQIASRIPPIDWRQISQDDRDQRREKLIEELRDVNLPVLDLPISLESISELGVRPMFGDWFVLGVVPREARDASYDASYSIYFSDPENPEETKYTPFSLAILVLAPEFWQRSLRDIFSLVHVADADFDEGEDGSPLPTPLPTPSSPLGTAEQEFAIASSDEVVRQVPAISG